eukprot:c11327_g1_i2.p1 GENE.c11327_g1_i2~~c11327_g1_i2.p1  ORF type:complete len:306 (-),score=105.94 c11327_g1_i2:231-1148(-)
MCVWVFNIVGSFPSDEMWTSFEFVVLLRVVLPVLNSVSAARAVWGSRQHILALKASRRPSSDKVLGWMVCGLIVETVACMLRAVYLALGPLYCNALLHYSAHSYLINITTPLEIIATMSTVVVFRQWTAFGNRQRVGVRGQVCFAVVASLIMVLELLAGNARNHFGSGVLYTVISALIYVPTVVLSSTLFLFAGCRFLRALQSMFDSENKTRAIQKAVKWLIAGAVSELLLLVSMCLVFDPDVFAPWGMFRFYALTNTATSLLSLSYVLALVPQRRKSSIDKGVSPTQVVPETDQRRSLISPNTE